MGAAQVPPPPGPSGPPPSSQAAPRQAFWQVVPWGVGDAIGVFGLAFVLTLVAGSLINALLPPGLVPDEVVNAAYGPLTLVILGLTTWGWVRVRDRGAIRLLTGSKRAGGRDVMLALAVGVGAVLVITLGLGVASGLLLRLFGLEMPVVQQELRDIARNPQTAPIFALSALLVAPVFEELFFRGMVFPAIARRAGLWAGIALSALVFGIVHLNQAADLLGAGLLLVRLVPLGMLFAWLYHWRGTLVVPIIVHSVFNAASVVMLFLGLG